MTGSEHGFPGDLAEDQNSAIEQSFCEAAGLIRIW